MEDLISRKAALDALCDTCTARFYRNFSAEECRNIVKCAFVKAIEELESVEAIPTSFPVSVTMEQVEAMRNTPFPMEEMKTNCLKPEATDPKRHDKAEALNYALFVLKRRESTGERMEFPEDWHDFIKTYALKYKDEVYTNGSMVIPAYRMEQAMEHYIGKAARNTDGHDEMIDAVREAPTIDAVPVVRCSECIHRYKDGENVVTNRCELNHARVQLDDFFCADGERRNG